MKCFLPEFDMSATHTVINDGRSNRVIVHCIDGLVVRAQRFIDRSPIERLPWTNLWDSAIKRQCASDIETTYEFYEMER